MPLAKVDIIGNDENVPVRGKTSERRHALARSIKLQSEMIGTLEPLLTYWAVLECRAMLGVESLPGGASHAHRGDRGMAGAGCF